MRVAEGGEASVRWLRLEGRLGGLGGPGRREMREEAGRVAEGGQTGSGCCRMTGTRGRTGGLAVAVAVWDLSEGRAWTARGTQGLACGAPRSESGDDATIVGHGLCAARTCAGVCACLPVFMGGKCAKARV